jgi:hypothetical protein
VEIKLADKEFRPVTLTLETQDEFDQLFAVVAQVANNSINHGPRIIEAAKWFANHLNRVNQQQGE